MPEYISREAANDTINETAYEYEDEKALTALYHAADRLNELPAADAIEELSRQRDRAYARLCEWCGVCPEGKRNPEDCEIAALNPEPPKEEN